MGQKNLKGSVSIFNDNNRIRLRWRYLTQRYSINLYPFSKSNLHEAKKTAISIERDMAQSCFDYTLNKYKGKVQSPDFKKVSIVQCFEEWTTSYKQMDYNKHCNYRQVRNMINSWGDVKQTNILISFNKCQINERTYNRRLSMLKQFSEWLVKNSVWSTNPFEDVNPKRVKRVEVTTRKPLTKDEIIRILEAFRNNTCCPEASRFKHSHYYPFIYFVFKTGVRNAEAVGLRVGSVDEKNKLIRIKEVLARSIRGTNAAARERKETKNGKIRSLPLSKDLHEILKPLIKGKGPDELIFKSFTGLAIDDRMFQKRIFKPVLKKLHIEERVLYACRHTFGSRCMQEGLTPIMTAFLMGNNPETALRNYTHLMEIPLNLPDVQ